MQLKHPILHLLSQLQQVLERLTDAQYTTPVDVLSKATIGQHVRHVVEFFLELNKGYLLGTVNYDERKRDLLIETNRQVAIRMIAEISHSVSRPDKELLLIADLAADGEEPLIVSTNYFRELIYNLEHTVHHMALLRVGIGSVSGIILPERFGVALSTLQYRRACAQ
jgi:hypothetical protein